MSTETNGHSDSLSIAPQDAESLISKAQAKLLLTQDLAESRYQNDPWQFMVDCVTTLDQVKQQKRRFPPRNYQQRLTEVWLREKLLLVPKSRRMMISWTMVALHYWMIRFQPGSKVAFVSRKEGRDESEGSAELVWRANFIHENLPNHIRKLPAEYKFCRFWFPSTSSEIIGVGQGAEQLRQYTFTAIFADELAFWEWAREAYVACRPTIEGGGRFTGISSARPGFFKQLVFDEAV